MSKNSRKRGSPHSRLRRKGAGLLAVAVIIISALSFYPSQDSPAPPQVEKAAPPASRFQPGEKWLQRAYLIDDLFHKVYTPCWEGANGAIGDAYLFAITHDSSLLRFHTVD